MRRRVRAIMFGCAALLCAGLAAAMTGGYRQDIQTELGPLRPVVAASGVRLLDLAEDADGGGSDYTGGGPRRDRGPPRSPSRGGRHSGSSRRRTSRAACG